MRTIPRFFVTTPLVVLLLAILVGEGTAYFYGTSPHSGEVPQAEEGEKETPSESSKPKSYEEVITEEAVTSEGLFTVHRVEEKLYFEIPPDLMGRDMLWYTEVAKVPPGIGYAGQPVDYRVVRWERRDKKVYLRSLSFLKRAGNDPAIGRAVERASLPPIIMSFKVETESKNSSPVIEVTRLFTSDVPEFSARGTLSSLKLSSPPSVDSSRSYVDEVKTFPENIETRSLITYSLGPPPLAGAGHGSHHHEGIPGDVRSVSILVHYSMTLLPEEPMRGRYFDPRVGYFTRSFEDYRGDRNRVVERKFINRYRLEKKDPGAPLSEPREPITFYLSREVPKKWRPYIRKGVEDWNAAFKEAGFESAIVARDAPTEEEDPSWDPEDARFSVIRWSAEPKENAMGPHVHDPRSGEIISSHIVFWHDILKRIETWYFLMCSPLDPRAGKLPLPEPVMGRLLRYIAAHEVGHSIGLLHNHKASSAYTVAELRDPEFTGKYGNVASIMSYGRFNYVAQPGDGVKQLTPVIGPYDRFAIEWGYQEIAGAMSPKEEVTVLDMMAARQIDDPWLRFGGEDGPARVDPTVKMENIGSDPVEATAMGLKNLDRVLSWIVPATTRLGEDYTELEETYESLLELRAYWFASVAKLVGGVVETRYLGGRGDEPFSRVPKEKQREAVVFLLTHAFAAPTTLIAPAIVNRIHYIGLGEPVKRQQRRLLESLLSEKKMNQLTDGEILSPEDTYTILDLVVQLQEGIWMELGSPEPAVGLYRRALQRAYLERMRELIGESSAPSLKEDHPDWGFHGNEPRSPIEETDFRAVARWALGELDESIESAIGRTMDEITLIHLEDSRREIELILRPEG